MEISAPIMVRRNFGHDFIFYPNNQSTLVKIVDFRYYNTQLK